MNDLHELDGLLVDHLRRHAGDATPLPQLDAILESDRVARLTPIGRHTRSNRGRVFVAAAALAALGVGALAVVASRVDQPGASADDPVPSAPSQPLLATIGNYVPGGTLGVANQLLIEEARFDSDETSYARLVGLSDAASSTPDERRTVVTSIWRSMSIETIAAPIAATETPVSLDGLEVTIQTDSVGDHHLVEFTRPDGDQVRIEGTAISLPAFVEAIEDLVYADATTWATVVDAMVAPTGTEFVVDTVLPTADESVGTPPPFVKDESGITIPADTRPAGDAPAGTLPVPADTPAPQVSSSDTGRTRSMLFWGDARMFVIDQPSAWILTSSVVGEVDQAVWTREPGDGAVIVTVTSTGVPPVTVAPDASPNRTVVEPGGFFADGEPATNGVFVDSDVLGRQHVVELYGFEDGAESPFQVAMAFSQMSLEEVTAFLTSVRAVDADEWERIAGG